QAVTVSYISQDPWEKHAAHREEILLLAGHPKAKEALSQCQVFWYYGGPLGDVSKTEPRQQSTATDVVL
ncbi:unnamed protein product, partial [Amoebophrya sp. A25]